MVDENVFPKDKATVTAGIDEHGQVTITINGKAVATGKGGKLTDMPLDGLDVGKDTIGRVGDYANEFPLKGSISDLEIKIQQ